MTSTLFHTVTELNITGGLNNFYPSSHRFSYFSWVQGGQCNRRFRNDGYT